VLENYDITGRISVKNTDKPLEIRNISVIRSTGPSVPGIEIENSTDITISNSLITLCGEGIQITTADSITVNNNNISANTGNGMKINYCNNSIIEDNTIANNQESGIVIGDASGGDAITHNVNITNNWISENTVNGIHIYSCYIKNRILHNTIWNNGDKEQITPTAVEGAGIIIGETDHNYYTTIEIIGNGVMENYNHGIAAYIISGPFSVSPYISHNAVFLNDEHIDKFDDDKQFYDLNNGITNPDHSNTISDIRLDSDLDGLMNFEEAYHGTHPMKIDTDNDNLLDDYEIKIGTNPHIDDTDGDGYLDGAEIRAKYNPLDPDDHPGVQEYPDITQFALLTGAIAVALIAPIVLLFTKKKRD